MGMPLVCVNRIWNEPFDSGGTWTLEFMWTENCNDSYKFDQWKINKQEAYRFTGAAGKGERSTGRVSESSPVVNNSRIKYVGGDDILKVLKELYSPIGVFQFGDEH
jgi:hypothetical protein